jgi:large repetitive protein
MGAIGLSTPEVYLEDIPLNLADIVIDIADGATAMATLTLSDPAAGALSTDTSGGVTSTYDSATGTWSATGPIADVNAVLAAVTFTPTENFNGNFDIATSVIDDTGTFTGDKLITGTAVNDAPIAVDDSYTTTEDTALSVAAPGILGNDTDVDGGQLTPSVVSPPVNGTVTLDTAIGAFIYTPNPNFNGTDTFTYQVTDGTATSNLATVTLTVTPVNDPPVAANDSYITNENTTLSVPGASLLANDTDVDGDALTASLVGGPAHGAVTFNTDGSFTYTPAANFTGTDSFTYQLNDGTANSNVATVSLTVSPTAEADLSVLKTVDNPTPNVGDLITFIVTLTDVGPDDATNVELTDVLPAGLAFVTATPSQGTYDPSSGLWTVGTVSPGGSQTLSLTARVDSPAALTNTGSIIHADQFDPDPANNTASATETPLQADLSVLKTVSNPTPNVGDTITFTVTLADVGPDAATNVLVTDLLPAGLTLVSAIPSLGTYTAVTGLWDVGTVSSGSAQTLIINARVDSPAALR